MALVLDIAMSLFEEDSVAHEFHPKSFPCWVVAVRTDDFSLGKGWMMEHSEYDDKMDEFNSELEDELAKRKPKKDGPAYSEGFEKFWAAYPLKTGKSAALEDCATRILMKRCSARRRITRMTAGRRRWTSGL